MVAPMGVIGILMAMLSVGTPNELLDYMDTAAYWKMKNVAVVSVETMTAELEEVKATGDIDALIKQLGDADFGKREAAQKGVSLNKAIISLLERAVGTKSVEKKKRVLYSDLDHLAGLWSREEAASFDKTLKAQRKVDAELWKKSK
jgi:hypothetical protein